MTAQDKDVLDELWAAIQERGEDLQCPTDFDSSFELRKEISEALKVKQNLQLPELSLAGQTL